MMAIFLIFGLILSVVLFLSSIRIYNSLVSLKNQVDRAWSNIDVILKQRFDEVPQLVQVIEQYASHEKTLIDRLVKARQAYGTSRDTVEKVQSTQEFNLALRGVMAIGEAYPELKSNTNFVQLQTRLSALEDHIADRREVFNEAVTNFNTRKDQFPDILFAGFLGYRSAELFKVAESDKAMPNLKMNIG